MAALLRHVPKLTAGPGLPGIWRVTATWNSAGKAAAGGPLTQGCSTTAAAGRTLTHGCCTTAFHPVPARTADLTPTLHPTTARTLCGSDGNTGNEGRCGTCRQQHVRETCPHWRPPCSIRLLVQRANGRQGSSKS